MDKIRVQIYKVTNQAVNPIQLKDVFEHHHHLQRPNYVVQLLTHGNLFWMEHRGSINIVQAFNISWQNKRTTFNTTESS